MPITQQASRSGFVRLSSPCSMAVLEDGAVLQINVDGSAFRVEKRGGELEAGADEPDRPFLVLSATTGALDSLSRAADEVEFGESFARGFTDGSIELMMMAPPGTAVTFGVISMLRRMGIRPNLIGGD
jgi:hypothetical protein